MNVTTLSGEAVECVLRADAIVGESPQWHQETAKLYWVDIQNKHVHRFDPLTGMNQTFDLPELVTSLAFRVGGGLILSLKKTLAFFNPDSAELQILKHVEEDKPDNRFNDGKCDPQGRFWVGTMGDKNWKAPVGNLYNYSAHGQVAWMRGDVICSNGVGWSPDGRTMYHTETFRYAIFAFDFDEATGALSRRRVFAQIDENSGGFPDGLTVDAEGGVWSNQVGLGRIVRYLPNATAGTVEIERVIQLPVPRATSCTFGGPDLDTLYITSARETMNAAQLKAAPLSGSLFAVKPGVKGRAANYFNGSFTGYNMR